jgi:hypothetical protein
MKTNLLLLNLFFLLSFAGYSQVTGGGGSTLNGGSTTRSGSANGNLFLAISVPTGEFSDENNGAAKTGLGFGYDFVSGKRAVRFLWQQVLTYHSAEASYSYYDQYSGQYYNYNAEWGYLNAYELFGIRVDQGNDNLKYFGQLGLGVGLSTLTGDLDESGLGVALAYGVGAGIVISKHLNLGFRLLSCKPKYADLDASQQISEFNLTIGYEF